MFVFSRIAPCVAGLLPVIGAAIVPSRPVPTRAAVMTELSEGTPVWTVPCPTLPRIVADTSVSPPPAGDDAYRPAHFTVAPIIVTFERSRLAGMTRLGSLYGP